MWLMWGSVMLQVKLVGPYLSCEIEVHIQGPFLVMDRCVPFIQLLLYVVATCGSLWPPAMSPGGQGGRGVGGEMVAGWGKVVEG